MTRNERRPTAPPPSHQSPGGWRVDTPVIVAPHHWCGEADCLVGPFASAEIAWKFAGLGPCRGAYEVHRFELRQLVGGVYLGVTRADMK